MYKLLEEFLALAFVFDFRPRFNQKKKRENFLTHTIKKRDRNLDTQLSSAGDHGCA